MNNRDPFILGQAARAITASIRSTPHLGRLMRTLCRTIGPRTPASQGMRKAQQFLRREWSDFGAADVHVEPVALDGWQEGTAEVVTTAPVRLAFDAIQAIHSASASVEAQLVDAGGLTFADLYRIGDAAKGSVLLVDGHTLSTRGAFEPIQRRISLAEATGVAAVLLAGWHPALPSIQFLNRSSVPVISLSVNAVKTLRRLVRRQTVRVRVRTRGRTKRVTCHNLIGELGPDGAKDLLIISAHLDGFYLSPAAIDNLSGVVTMTEIGRALAPYQSHFMHKLRLIAFTGEEYGFAGSKEYVRAHAPSLGGTRFVLNLDTLFENTAKGIAVMCAPKLRDYFANHLRRSHPTVDVRDLYCVSSDYLPFLLAGIPAARPADWKNTYPRYAHTILDVDRRVSTRWLKANADLCASILLRLLTDPRAPIPRRKSTKEVRRLLRDAGVEEALRWQVLLPA